MKISTERALTPGPVAHSEEIQFEPSDCTILEWKGYSGRGGDIEGMFAVDRAGLDRLVELIGTTVYFGEVLGKHSDVCLDLEWNQFTTRANGEQAAMVVAILDTNSFGGFNPLDYDLCEECGDTFTANNCKPGQCGYKWGDDEAQH